MTSGNPNTELCLARYKILANASDQTTLARNLLKPECRHSHNYSSDKVKVVKHGSLRPYVAPRFKKVVPGQMIADTQQYKVLEDLILADNRWSQLNRNIIVETGRRLMRVFGSRKKLLTNALKSGLSKSTLKFYDRAADASSREYLISPGPSRPRPIVTSN